MTLLDDILKAIGTTDSLEIKHNFNYFSSKGDLVSPNKNLGTELQQIFEHILTNELFIVISLKNGEQDSIKFSSANIGSFNDRSSEFFGNYDENEKTTFEIESKNWENLNIFHIPTFIDYLSQSKIADSLTCWSKYFQENRLIINIHSDYETTNNDYIFIHSVYSNHNAAQLEDWKKTSIDNKLLSNQIERRDKVSHFVNASQYNFTPECFSFDKNFFLKPHFDYLRSIFVLIFLSDYSSINEITFKFKIKGFKTLDCKLSEGSLSDSVNSELFDIYKWVYDEGSFVDKVGIARNVISIHVTDENISTLETGTCYSAQSGYDLYLKDNVKQYIEVKNKIADMLYNQSEKASGIVKDMFTKFKTSMWTLFSFFILSFLSKVYSKISASTPTLDTFVFNDSSLALSFSTKANNHYSILDILILDNSIICIGVLIILFSFCYLVFAYCESNDEINRLKEKYNEIENRYKDLLNEQDLEKILIQSNVDNKSPEERELNYIRNKRKSYTKWWSCINILLLALLLIPLVFK